MRVRRLYKPVDPDRHATIDSIEEAAAPQDEPEFKDGARPRAACHYNR